MDYSTNCPKHHPKLRKIFFCLKIFALPAWAGMSLFTIGIAFWLINIEQSPIQNLVSASFVSPIDQAYRLFAALPKRGEVLSQKVNYDDLRVLKLKDFFHFYRSPLESEAAIFVQVAKKYDLPWTLLPAIACKESGCGRIIPVGSYNPFGWAVYTGEKSGAGFNSWAEAIERVGRGLREEYFNKGLTTVAQIETRYTPSSAATHNGWKQMVEYFMAEIESWRIHAK